MKTRVAVVALVVALIAVLAIAACVSKPAEQPQAANGYNADCYHEQDTGEIVCQSNDDITIAGAYPVLAAANGQMVYCSVTSGVVQAATVVPTTVAALATVTWADCEPGSAAFSGAWDCRIAIHSTNRMTMTLYEADATPVPTASYAKIRYCVVGNK